MMEAALKGHLVLVMAPSGSGKSVLLQHLKQSLPKLHFAVSCTTRAMRPGEQEGQVYYFLSETEFAERLARGELLEWAEYGGHRYGTLRAEIIEPMKRGQVVVREVELQGIRSILSTISRENLTIIYIDGGEWETLKRRITLRAPMSDEALALRHERFLAETAAKPLADVIVKNEDGQVEKAKQSLVGILEKIMLKLESHD